MFEYPAFDHVSGVCLNFQCVFQAKGTKEFLFTGKVELDFRFACCFPSYCFYDVIHTAIGFLSL